MLSNIMDAEKRREDDDNELVALCRKGELEAFEMLVARHQNKIYNTAYRITGNQEDAAEVAQDAFLSAYRAMNTFEGKSLFSTWLHAITVNAARNRLKQSQTRHAHEPRSLDDPSPDGSGKAFEPVSDCPSALDRLSRLEQQRQIQKCLDQLDSSFREVIVLRDIQGFSYDEIAGMLSLAAGTVKSRLFRARDAVKECLKKAFGD